MPACSAALSIARHSVATSSGGGSAVVVIFVCNTRPTQRSTIPCSPRVMHSDPVEFTYLANPEDGVAPHRHWLNGCRARSPRGPELLQLDPGDQICIGRIGVRG